MAGLFGTFFLSLVITWGVGLAPPLLLRFVVLRRPLGRWPASSLVAVLWIGNLVLFTSVGSESRTHSALILIAIASFAILTYRAATPVGGPSRDGAPSESKRSTGGSRDDTGLSTSEQFGVFLAREALAWATSGAPSPVDALRNWDLPRRTSESQLTAEVYLLHVAAFADATLGFGADGMVVQAAMIREASTVVGELLGGRSRSDDTRSATLVSNALAQYLGSTPTDSSMSEVLRFGLIAISRIFGQPFKDPGAALFLVQDFHSARSNVEELIRNVLAEGLNA